MSRLTKEKINFIDDQLACNLDSTDAEMILDIAARIGKPVCKVSKLVKTERSYFQEKVVLEPAKVIRKYFR